MQVCNPSQLNSMISSYSVNLPRANSRLIHRLPTRFQPPLSHADLKRKLPHLLLQTSPSLSTLQSLHALIITNGFQFPQPIFLTNLLISSYSSLGQLTTSRHLFDEMPQRNSVSYNSIINAYLHQDEEAEAWQLFTQMMVSGIKPTQHTFGSLLSSSSLGLFQGLQLHSLVLKNGLFYSNAFSATSLLGFFGRLGELDMVTELFEEIPHRNLVTWNTIISLLAHHGFVQESVYIFSQLLRASFRPSEYSFVGVLCGFRELHYLETGKQIHGLVIKTGLELYTSVANALVLMYVQSSDVFLAEKLFKEMPVKDVVSWNTIIGAYSKGFDSGKGLELFSRMSLHGFTRNQATFASVISSCASLQNLKYGEFIHSKAIKNNFLSDIIVSSYSITDSLASCSLLQQMLCEGYRPNEFSFSVVLKSSSSHNLQQLHGLILKMGYHQHQYVSSSLIASYTANGMLSQALSFATDSTKPLCTVSSNIIAGIQYRRGQYEETLNVLLRLEEFDKVSWNTSIAACARSGYYQEAFELFKGMQLARILPDSCTIVSLLSISAKLCNLPLGTAIHGQVIKMDSNLQDVFVCNMLVDMYAKCGCIDSSSKVFNKMTVRNLISWTALISGLAHHGHPTMALERFREMESLTIIPDRVTFIAVLSACRHGGLVDKGMDLFKKMKESYGIEPEMDHYICVVDLLTRYGYLKEAKELIDGMPFQPNVVIWRIFLEGCKRYNSVGEF